MSELHWTLASEADTLALGQRLAAVLAQGGVLYLQGDLGAGKTTLSRGLIQALGHAGAVKSPTYTLVEPYDLPRGKLYHFDLYRLNDPEELELIGIRDYFAPSAICVVEWPDKGGDSIPEPDLILELETAGTGRSATLIPNTQLGMLMAKNLA
ncbi:MAG TPA: tRNA (adenosine(37)-N6)-threonylcarbamoyltransferase complex ATPase subunit type 1 TsaE [Dongiaceae bacterium]|nr:tRNA (adenosine(37)-N6)-threonylcarbamoyltransferase complex ATPase subunit type 1 TsaE [Dongiaceae bacterium]